MDQKMSDFIGNKLFSQKIKDDAWTTPDMPKVKGKSDPFWLSCTPDTELNNLDPVVAVVIEGSKANYYTAIILQDTGQTKDIRTGKGTKTYKIYTVQYGTTKSADVSADELYYLEKDNMQ